MKIRRFVAVVACAGAMFSADYANGTTVTVGPTVSPTGSNVVSCNYFQAGCLGFTFAQLTSLSLDEVPADGVINTWRVAGESSVALHVLRPGEEEGGAWFGQGVSALATNLKGGPNSTSLPVRAGDIIGVDVGGPNNVQGLVYTEDSVGSEYLLFQPALPAFGGGTPNVQYDKYLLVNADVVLAPTLSSVSPAQGPTGGGNAVAISGLYLDGATGVSFGSVPASSFVIDSANHITAVAPASAAGSVDVHVIGPGGSSAVVEADRYTFTASATAPAAPGTGVPSGGQVVADPAVGGLGQTASRWRRGQGLPHISRAGVPVGTTFSFNLNEAATSSFAFSRRAAGRRAKGRCVAVTPGNAGRRRCTRMVSAGGFSLPGHAGVNKVFFQGRLSSSKTLKPGTYSLLLSVRDARGLTSSSRSLSFTIVS
jgi:hypothetical protein